jgi:hypothetical protein
MEAPPLPGNFFMHSKAGNICHSQNSELFMRFTLDDEKEYSGPDSFRNVEFKAYIKAEPEFTKFYGRPNLPASHKINTPTPAFVPGVLKTLI